MLKKKIFGLFLSLEDLTISYICELTHEKESEVTEVIEQLIKEGKIKWDAKGNSNGIYILKVDINGKLLNKKLNLLK